ncbi:MAG TPA: succinate dehydrogenase assembly factor 2 [Gammaproteobacteria bacterium]|nr:succinate dehydrogenase assembly factor 2 [Gammaproteobacteria bacterium]
MSRDEQENQATEGLQPSIGQLRWRTRRGLRELDLMLQRYLSDHYPTASAADQKAFAELLEQNDADILDWLLGRAVPPPEMANVIAVLGSRS